MSQFLVLTACFAALYFSRVVFVNLHTSDASFEELLQAAPQIDFEHCRNTHSKPSLRSADLLIVPACIIFAALFTLAGLFVFPRSSGTSLTRTRVITNISLLYVGPVLGVIFRVIGTKPATVLPTKPFVLSQSVQMLVALWKFSHPTADALLWASHSLAVFCFLVQIWCPSARQLMFVWALIAIAFLGDIIGHMLSDPISFCVRQTFMQQWDSSSVFHVMFHEFTAWLVNLYSVTVVS
jgi:hypothetical protein